jgi:hypothetical protein
MPSLPFSFDGVADPNGVIHVTRMVPVGLLRIKITHFSLRTHNGCNSRVHQVARQVNDDDIFHGEMHDCADLTIDSNRAWRGALRLHFTADGFRPHEQIAGAGAVEFRAALL